MKGIVISGTKSGIGKTTITMALMSVFENVAPFKIGPDFIDPKFQEFVTGNKSYNLDAFILNKNKVKELFYEKSQGKEISIIEGVMGLYDGLDHSLDNFSTGHVSRILKMPVILVVDGRGLSTSIAAEVMGYKLLDERINIAGVIINNVSSQSLYEHLKEAIEKFCDVECLGYFPKMDGVVLESRHLGLVQAEELDGLQEKIENLRIQAKKSLNLKRILELSKTIEDVKSNDRYKDFEAIKDKLFGKRVAIAKDAAFSFYYNDNLELIEKTGAEIHYFSPLKDKKLPENIDFLYFGGGYPELYAKELSENIELINEIQNYFNKNQKIYAECGGFIYLTRGLKTLDEDFYPFAGLLNIKTEMKKNLNIGRFGYITLTTSKGETVKGHEFHYSDIYDNFEENTEFYVEKYGGKNWRCGYKKNSLIAGYPHINFFSSIEFFKRLIGIEN